jgi:aryl-alcohol dehydrogenase-like predicted oxidoreductase
MPEMTYRPLGSSGLVVSTVGLGTNAFGSRIDAEQTRAVVDAAIDEGVTLFDTADTYGAGASEELLGAARRSVAAATTSWSPPSSAWTCGAPTGPAGLVTPVAETLEALTELVAEGKVRYLGCSNFVAWEVVEAHWTATTAGRSASCPRRTSTPCTTARRRRSRCARTPGLACGSRAARTSWPSPR